MGAQRSTTNEARARRRRGILVIAYGNDLRGDDGAALRVAQRLVECRTTARIICSRQLFPEFAEDIALAARVIFVDACLADDTSAALDIARIEAPVVGEQAPAHSHHASPQQLLALAARLYGADPEAWRVAIPAYDWRLGAAISPATARQIEAAVACCRVLAQGASRQRSHRSRPSGGSQGKERR